MSSHYQRVLVTGGTGLIGSNLVYSLRERGIEVVSIGSEIDLRCPSTSHKLFQDIKPTSVFHLAAKVGGIHANSSYKSDFYYDNVLINTNVVKAALDAETQYFFAMGTGCAYPKRLENVLLQESTYLDGIPEFTNDAYAYAKRGLLVHLTSLPADSLNYTFCIPANIYGPHDNFHPQNSHVVPGLINRFHMAKLNNTPSVNVWGDGSAKRDFLYIDDCIEAILFLADKQHEGSYNVSSGTLTSIRELAISISQSLDYAGDICFDTGMPSGQSQRIFDNQRILRLGWEHTTELSVGIKKTVDWYSKNHHSARRK